MNGRGGIDAEVKKLGEAIKDIDSLKASYQGGLFAIPEETTKEKKLEELMELGEALEEWKMKVEGSITWTLYPWRGLPPYEKAVRAGLRHHGRVVRSAPQYIFDQFKEEDEGNKIRYILEITSSIFTGTGYLCWRVEQEKENARPAEKK